MHTIVRQRKRAEQPTPYRALVIGAVTMPGIALVLTHVSRILHAEAAQAVARQQFAGAGVDHGAHLCGPQWAEWQRDGKKLIGPHARIATRASIDVDHIVQATALRIPESIKMSAGVRQQGFTSMRCPCRALSHSALTSTHFPILGVTTQSPTLASIHVSCIPGSPARSSPSAGSTPMP